MHLHVHAICNSFHNSLYSVLQNQIHEINDRRVFGYLYHITRVADITRRCSSSYPPSPFSRTYTLPYFTTGLRRCIYSVPPLQTSELYKIHRLALSSRADTPNPAGSVTPCLLISSDSLLQWKVMRPVLSKAYRMKIISLTCKQIFSGVVSSD